MIPSITVTELKQWLDNDEAVLIDVREPAEHSAVNIKQAMLIPLSEISLKKLPDCGNKKLVIHCKSGMRSTNACTKLLGENPDLMLHNLDGGILAWQKAGFSVGSSGKNILPLDRQVQLTIGIMLLIGAFFTTFFSALFIVVSILIGMGLSFAGLTGHCGLAMVIAKMPWNKKI